MRTLLALLLTLSPLAAETYLVCAGVETYDDAGISSLKYAVADVTAFAAAFRDAGVPEGNITLLTSDAADRRSLPTKAGLLRALQSARSQARADDTILFFFSGHGMEREGEPYLLTFDSNAELLDETALSMSVINQALRGFQGANLLLVIDACRNDPDAGKAAGNAALDESFAKGLRPKLLPREAGAREPNVALLLACEVGQRAWEMPEKEQGAFTYWLLQGLRSEAPRTADGVALDGLAGYLSREVPAWAKRAGRQQTPRYEQVSGGGFLLPAPRPPGDGGVKPMVLPAVLDVTSVPDQATVLVDGREEGRTPFRKEYDLQGQATRSVTVRVELAGYAAQAAQVELVAGATTPRRDIRLVKVERPPTPTPQPQPTPTPAPVGGQRPANWPDYLSSYTPPAGMSWSSYRVSAKDDMPQVLIPAGEFLMGSPANEPDRSDDEGPQKNVYVSAFWMDLHEVTVAQYQAFCDATGRQMEAEYNKDARHPVGTVSWEDATAYAQWAGRQLPTEAQWEKAARGGTTTVYPWGDTFNAAKANNNGQGTTPVVSYAPNGYGLYDMIGNVWEWCRDWYDEGWYGKMPTRDPVNETQTTTRVLRGGSWYDYPRTLRVALRTRSAPDGRGRGIGFRCSEAP